MERLNLKLSNFVHWWAISILVTGWHITNKRAWLWSRLSCCSASSGLVSDSCATCLKNIITFCVHISWPIRAKFSQFIGISLCYFHLSTLSGSYTWNKTENKTSALCRRHCFISVSFQRLLHVKQGVALTGRNRTGPPCSVGRPTAHAPDCRHADRPALQTTTDDDDRRRQTPASKTMLAH